jgi:hypothetical protein
MRQVRRAERGFMPGWWHSHSWLCLQPVAAANRAPYTSAGAPHARPASYTRVADAATPGQYLPLRIHSSSNSSGDQGGQTIVSVLRGGDYLYFNQGVFGQANGLHGGAGGRGGGEVASVDLVHRGKLIHVFQKDRGLHHVMEI